MIKTESRGCSRPANYALVFCKEEGSAVCGESDQTEARVIAENVTGVVIPGCGHFRAEEAPDALIEVLDPFLAPYKVGWASFAD